jgi:CubicO group peptidase (beta-lactamase class C family)
MKLALALAALAVADLPDLQAVLDEQRAAQDVPGVSAVVVRRDEVVFAAGSGVADIETGRAMTPDTPLYIGSVSKVLTAALVLRLIEDGRLRLEDPVEFVATGAPLPVTVSQLLAHSSGLEREGDFAYWFTAGFPDRAALRAYLGTASLRFTPGSDLHYSNVGYAALGLLIEDVLGTGYGEALAAGVLEPLGMRSSGAPGPAAGVAAGYSPPDRLLPSDERPFAGVGRKAGNRHVRLYHDAAAMSPAFGAYSTATDLGRLARFLLGDGDEAVLSRQMRNRMRERQPSGRGLGLRLARVNDREVARHDGWFAAHRSHLLIDHEAGIGVAVLANGDNASAREIAEALYLSVAGGRRPRDRLGP